MLKKIVKTALISISICIISFSVYAAVYDLNDGDNGSNLSNDWKSGINYFIWRDSGDGNDRRTGSNRKPE